MSPEAQRVHDALNELYTFAGVFPADPGAGPRLRAAILAHPLLPAAHDIASGCVLSELLRRMARVEHLVVTTERVLLTRVGGAEPRHGGRAEFGRESVMHSAALRSAIQLLDQPGAAPTGASLKTSTTPRRCGTARRW